MLPTTTTSHNTFVVTRRACPTRSRANHCRSPTAARTATLARTSSSSDNKNRPSIRFSMLAPGRRASIDGDHALSRADIITLLDPQPQAIGPRQEQIDLGAHPYHSDPLAFVRPARDLPDVPVGDLDDVHDEVSAEAERVPLVFQDMPHRGGGRPAC